MHVAVTGHMDVADDATELIRSAIDTKLEELRRRSDSIVGISCIARGADSIFAKAILDQGFTLEVVLPSKNYRTDKVKPHDLERFDTLATAASVVHVMPFNDAGREAYEAANSTLLRQADILIAVWDGDESKRGGTGTVVAEARTIGIPVTVIWPEGAHRQSASTLSTTTKP